MTLQSPVDLKPDQSSNVHILGAALAGSKEWLTTACGGSFDLCGQDERQVRINDIAAALAKQCRFNGASIGFYSVAQHSCVVADALKRHGPMVQLLGLMHDAHEAYTGDIAAPVKRVLGSVGAYNALLDLEETIQRTIHRAFRLPEKPSKQFRDLVAMADEAALATELRDVMAEPDRAWSLKAKPLPTPIIVWPWPKAEEKFLQKFHDLSVAAATTIGA
jgi:hypothetical protein